MFRRSMSAACLVVALAAGSLAVSGCVKPTPPQAQTDQTFAEVQSAVISATGYQTGAVEIKGDQSQVVVTLVNSRLVGQPAAVRETEAERIVSTIVRTMGDKPRFSAVHTIHLDYVTRNADGSGARVADALDFRKDPQGVFQHHIT